MECCSPKLGEGVTVVWKRKEGSALGGTEGVVVGVMGDEVSGEYLILDRSTYQNSLKSVLFSLGILDLKVIPVAEIESTKARDLRTRPPGISETLKWNIEVDYKSNVDYDETVRKLQRRTDCQTDPNQPAQTEGYCGITIRNIDTIEGAKIVISPKGNVQIVCVPLKLDECVKWLQEAVAISPDHKHLVLIPTYFSFNIHEIFKELAYPTEEIIDKIAETDGNQPIILPLGWVHAFFVELDRNPLQALFSGSGPLDDLVLIRKKSREDKVKASETPVKTDFVQLPMFVLPQRQATFNRYLGANVPIMRVTGLLKSPQEEEELMKMWLGSRSDAWQWLKSEQFQGKAVIRDLTVNRETSSYTIDFRKYSDNESYVERQES